MDILFLAFTSLKSKGGTEKIIFALTNHFANEYKIFVLSNDSKKDWTDLGLNENIKHLFVPFGSKNLLKIFISLIFLTLYLTKYKPAIIHSHHRRTTLIFSVFKLLPFTKFRLIHTSHTVFDYGRFFKYAQCDLLVGVGDHAVRNLIDFFGFKNEKVKLIYNGVQEYRGTGLSPQNKSAAVVGRLSDKKGHLYLLKAWEKVIKNIPNAILYVVGEGERKEELENYVSEFNLSQNVIFIGFYPDPVDWMLKTEFCVLPSLLEGLPLSILEAFSAKRTTIATRIDGIQEVVIDRKTGLLVPPKNPEKLAEAIIFLFNNPDLRREMAENGYKMFKRKFTLDKMLQEYKKTYETVMNL